MTGKLFWPGVVVGWALMAVGFVGIAGEGRDVPPLAFGRWVVGLALVHDLVLAPLALGVGAALARLLRPPWRAIAGAALIVAGPVVLFAWPYVAGWGRSRANPSIQPRDYTHGLVVLLASIAAVAVLLASVEVVRRGRARERDAARRRAGRLRRRERRPWRVVARVRRRVRRRPAPRHGPAEVAVVAADDDGVVVVDE